MVLIEPNKSLLRRHANLGRRQRRQQDRPIGRGICRLRVPRHARRIRRRPPPGETRTGGSSAMTSASASAWGKPTRPHAPRSTATDSASRRGPHRATMMVRRNGHGAMGPTIVIIVAVRPRSAIGLFACGRYRCRAHRRKGRLRNNDHDNARLPFFFPSSIPPRITHDLTIFPFQQQKIASVLGERSPNVLSAAEEEAPR